MSAVLRDLRFAGMPFILNENDEREKSLKAVTDLSEIIARYHKIESLSYDSKECSMKGDFETCLIGLYVEILICQVGLVRQFRRNFFVAGLQDILKYQNWEARIEKLRKKDVDCRAFTSVFDSEVTYDSYQLQIQMDKTLSEVDKAIKSYRQGIEEMTAVINKWEILSVLSNLSEGIALQQHEDVLGEKSKMGTKYAQSGKWLLEESPEFGSWANFKGGSNPVFWLKGPAGVGKTSIVSRVIEYFLDPETPEATIAYFYCDRSAEGLLESDPNRVLRSLLRQLAWTSDNSVDEDIILAMGDRKGLPSSDCVKHLITRIKATDGTIIIIDALDECKDFDGLLEHLVHISDQCKDRLHLFLSSRD